MGIVSTTSVLLVKDDVPWRIMVTLVEEETGAPFPFPAGYLPKGQIRIPGPEIILLTDPSGADLDVDLGAAVFVVQPVEYEDVPISKDPVSWFSWWLTNGTNDITCGIAPMSVINR